MNRCSFLQQRSAPPAGFTRSVFTHQVPGPGQAEVHYFPPRSGKAPSDVVVFFPGNPGLVDYYTPFFLKLQSHISPHFALLAHSHIGHSPSLSHPTIPLTLNEQIETKVEFVRCLRRGLADFRTEQGAGQGEMRIGLMGHSVGSEMVVQTIRRLETGTWSEEDLSGTLRDTFKINAAFLLFPTISHIAATPNGRRLQPIFNPPLIQLLPLLTYFLKPFLWLLSAFAAVLPSSSSSSIYFPNATTLSFLSSPSTVKHVLNLAKSEMFTIREPDLEWYADTSDRLWTYWGKEDGWVGGQGTEVKRVMRSHEMGNGSERVEQEDTGSRSRVVDCADNISHAFCLAHSDIIAEKVSLWIREAFPSA